MDLVELLKQVDELKVEIDALRPIDPEQEQRIMQKFRLDWTYHSNAIEGNSLTFGETRAVLLHGITAQGSKPLRDYLDIKGHGDALDALQDFIKHHEPLTEAVLRELHKILLITSYDVYAETSSGQPTKKRVIPGQYKSMPNHVRTSTGEVHYYASPEETPSKMADLMAWYRRELVEKNELHPLILAATFHYQFVTIHPFDDGNGRMARLLMNLILMQAGYPPVVIPLNMKNEYLLALEQADADNELTPFIGLVGQALLKSLDLFLRGARGESIEEVKDLDKKLALLNINIEAQKEKSGPERNSSSLQFFYTRILIPIWSHLQMQLLKFDSFFYESEVEIFYDNSRKVITVESVLPHLEQYLVNSSIRKLRISYGLNRFKLDESFRIHTLLYFEANQFSFEMKYQLFPHHTHAKLLVNERYNSALSDEDIQKRISKMTNEIFELIERKTAHL